MRVATAWDRPNRKLGVDVSQSRHLVQLVEFWDSLQKPGQWESRLSQRQAFQNRLEYETVLVLSTTTKTTTTTTMSQLEKPS